MRNFERCTTESTLRDPSSVIRLLLQGVANRTTRGGDEGEQDWFHGETNISNLVES
jgi:hypothetical protein